MPNGCLAFTPNSTFVKFSWHNGHGVLDYFSDYQCKKNMTLVTKDGDNEWKCMSVTKLGTMNSIRLPTYDSIM